jgi:hypothetical protein
MIDEVEINEHCVKHHSSHDLAKLTVYTKGRMPQSIPRPPR